VRPRDEYAYAAEHPPPKRPRTDRLQVPRYEHGDGSSRSVSDADRSRSASPPHRGRASSSLQPVFAPPTPRIGRYGEYEQPAAPARYPDEDNGRERVHPQSHSWVMSLRRID
jgi:hypothetical protein